MLAQFYPPIVGGAELHVRSLGVELVRRGHEVDVATLWHDGLSEFEDDDGVRVHRIRGLAQAIRWLYGDPHKRPAMPLPDPLVVAAVARLVSIRRPDVVHAHNWLLHSFLPLKAWSGAPLVVTLHDFGLVCAKQTLVRSGTGDEHNCGGPGPAKCLRCAGRHYGRMKGIVTTIGNWGMGLLERAAVDLFMPVSADVAAGNRLAAQGLPFRVIPNFVPDDVNVPQADAQLYVDQLPPGDFLLFVGGLGRSKGIPVLLRAYEQLGAEAPPLVLIGYRTPESQELLARLPSRVIHFDSWPHAAVMEAWRRCLLGIVPSVWREPCPTVVIEAMAAGAPLIASRIGGIPELLTDGLSGLLVAPGDAGALAAKMRHLLSDRELQQRLGRAAALAAKRFQSGSVMPRIETAYADALNAHTASRARRTRGR